VANHAHDLGVHELLRNGRGLGRVRLVVLGNHTELHFLPADLEIRGIGVFYRELHAIPDVDADMRLGAGERRSRADLDAAIVASAGRQQGRDGEGDGEAGE
jgi:hypothetical protein